jgi:hypothetical protein
VLIVIVVFAGTTRGIELCERHGIVPEFVWRLQRVPCHDMAVVLQLKPYDLKQEEILFAAGANTNIGFHFAGLTVATFLLRGVCRAGRQCDMVKVYGAVGRVILDLGQKLRPFPRALRVVRRSRGSAAENQRCREHNLRVGEQRRISCFVVD